MIVLLEGKTLASGDLGILVRDEAGLLFDPALISYTIFSVDQQEQLTLAGAPKQIPQRSGTGAYWVSMTIPTGWEGRFKLVWNLVNFPGGTEGTVFEDFRVERMDPATTSFEAPSVLVARKPIINRRLAEAVMQVRVLLSDEDPDRNYHFRPPTPGRVVAGFNQRVGYIWDDATIIRTLRLAVAKLNTWNPMNLTHHTLETLPPDWVQCAALAAAASCLGKEAARWVADEYSYSLNGVSLDIQKSGSYLGLAQSLTGEFTEWAPLLTANRPYSAGLRQSRWLLG